MAHEIYHRFKNQNDRDADLTALTTRGGALAYASDNLRYDDDVIVTAVRQNPTALKFAMGEKNQLKAFLCIAGLWDEISHYNPNKTKVVLSTRFSLAETTSTTATIFALLLKKKNISTDTIFISLMGIKKLVASPILTVTQILITHVEVVLRLKYFKPVSQMKRFIGGQPFDTN